MVNSENNRWLVQSPQGEPIVMEIKHPVNIIVFGPVTCNG